MGWCRAPRWRSSACSEAAETPARGGRRLGLSLVSLTALLPLGLAPGWSPPVTMPGGLAIFESRLPSTRPSTPTWCSRTPMRIESPRVWASTTWRPPPAAQLEHCCPVSLYRKRGVEVVVLAAVAGVRALSTLAPVPGPASSSTSTATNRAGPETKGPLVEVFGNLRAPGVIATGGTDRVRSGRGAHRAVKPSAS
jgi:hypothetical protein